MTANRRLWWTVVVELLIVIFALIWWILGWPVRVVARLLGLSRDGGSWFATLASVSEETDEVFDFRPQLKADETHESLASAVIEHGLAKPNQGKLIRQLTRRFSISERQALTAIDRTLAGIARSTLTDCVPDVERDPIASIAHARALEDKSLVERIFADWSSVIARRDWVDDDDF